MARLRSLPALAGACLLAILLPGTPARAAGVADFPDDEQIQALAWRSIGPYRGGRSAAVAGVPGDPLVYYFGGTGGGVWKTSDGGRAWKPVSDGFFGGSIGAVAVSSWDPNVVYAGGGEKTVRGNVSHGDGIYRSTDAGRTWTGIGLEDSRHIPRIRIHPKNPDLVYVAALGHLFGPGGQRGIYRTTDGGENWERILDGGEDVGAVDLAMDPTNPRILYASLWRVRRTPYSLESGGPGCGLWKSSDGGDTWSELTGNPGLPTGTWGISGVTVSATNPDNLYAIIEAEEGGVFRSRDAGATWSRSNDQRDLRQRAWYYTRIYADPGDEESVYVVNVRFHHSKDGGRTFATIATPHGDNHDLWIAPEDPRRMIQANDGGANVSFDGGQTWSRQDNQPTAQFYRVTTDNHIPYRIYGAQQDNSAIRILHRSSGPAITRRHWESTAGGESGHLAPHPENPDIVYGGSYDGFMTRRDHATGSTRVVDVWPDNPMGWGAAELRYRFQWNFPIFFSPHDPGVLYAAANVLFRSLDQGASWTAISEDLTRDDKSRQGPSGGPITKDNTSVEYYATIFAALESPLEPGVLWTGSDDGLIHISRDNGQTWKNVTPSRLPEWTQINSMEADPFRPGGLYFAGTRYKLDDFNPYLYRTDDYGRTWKRIDGGIPRDHFTRVIRADHRRPGLLYAGTERGVQVSMDDGASWRPLQLKLPVVPVTDLALKDDDLIAATQGRSFWVLDDLSPLQQMEQDGPADEPRLFTPRTTLRWQASEPQDIPFTGANPPAGMLISFLLPRVDETTQVQVEIVAPDGATVRTYKGLLEPVAVNSEKDAAPAAATEDDEESEEEPDVDDAEGADDGDEKDEDKLTDLKAGLNRIAWDLRHAPPATFSGMVLWGGQEQGPRALPGTYGIRVQVGDSTVEADAVLVADPRSAATPADLEEQFKFLLAIRDKLTETHEAIATIKKVRAQIKTLKPRLAGLDRRLEIQEAATALDEQITAIEETLYQTKNRSPQDPLNFPIRLNNKLSILSRTVEIGDYPPTSQAHQVKEMLTTAIDEQLALLDTVWSEGLPAFNALIRDVNVPALAPDATSDEEGPAEATSSAERPGEGR